jgi:hypothetical protein
MHDVPKPLRDVTSDTLRVVGLAPDAHYQLRDLVREFAALPVQA